MRVPIVVRINTFHAVSVCCYVIHQVRATRVDAATEHRRRAAELAAQREEDKLRAGVLTLGQHADRVAATATTVQALRTQAEAEVST
jgi:hypothetical protein